LAQAETEIVQACDVLAKEAPSVFVEVGSLFGGSLYIYAGCCAPGATIISVDIGQEREALQRAVAKLCEEGYDAHFVEGRSEDPATIQAVRSILDGRGIDLLHIDGDHTEEGVRRDWENYRPMVREGGVVMFHDISPQHADAEVHRVWGKVKGERSVEFISKRNIGIGITWV
jgi:cephalosporin hydroxylase